MLTIGSQRHLFDIPSDVAYFNTAYNGPLLNASRERLIAAAQLKSQPWKRAADDFFEDADVIRQLCSALFGGDADGYAVIPAASYGISTAARAMEPRLRAGDRIVLIAEEFPSNVLPWRRVAAERGARIATVPMAASGDCTQALVDEIGRGAAVVALGQVHWTNGAAVDLARIGDACRDAGAALVLDVTQSLGAMPVELARVDPDFMVAAGYKWLLAPYGFGIMYVAPRWRDARPLEESWLARSGSSNFAGLVEYVDAYRPGARRFDVGEACVTTVLPGAIAALEQLAAWGLGEVTAALRAMTDRIAGMLRARGFDVPADARRAAHLLGARIPAHVSGDVVGALQRRGVFVSQRGTSLRFSPHLHVSGDDFARLAEGLDMLVGG